MSGYEPVLHALSAEPRVARPGDTVRLVFRTRNLGTVASPAATVRFALPAELEPLDPVAVAVAPAEPGEDVVAGLRARVAPGLDDRTELVPQAVLELDGGPLGSNPCTVVVHSRPLLDGPGSGVAVTALDGEIVRVRATVVNEGDGPARDLHVVVPVPAGCIALAGEAAGGLTLTRLDVGERAGIAYDARIVAPVDAVRAPDGYVAFADGTRCALPAREAVVLAPVLTAPRVVLVPGRRRADLAIELRNDGWVDARGVRVRVALPAPLRPLDGSLVVDGVPLDEAGEHGFGRAERVGAGLAVDVARVPARGTVRVGLALHVPPACPPGAIGVGAGGHDVVVPFVPAHVRDVRLRVAHAPGSAEPGARVAVVAELANAGDLPEALVLAAHGAGFAGRVEVTSGALAPGAVVPVTLTVRVDGTVADDTLLALTLVARDAGGERARTEVGLLVRDRVAAGTGALAPPAPDERRAAEVRAVLDAPASVVTGAPFAVRAEIAVAGPVETLAIRVPAVAGAAYVPGSTTLDGRALLDRAHGSPLAGDGLLLRGVPAATRIGLAWALLSGAAPGDDPLALAVELTADGEPCAVAAARVAVRAHAAFAVRPAGLPYHVDACTVAANGTLVPDRASPPPPPAAVPEPVPAPEGPAPEPVTAYQPEPVGEPGPEPVAFAFVLRLDGGRLEEIARLLRGAAGSGLVAHVLALRAFFPDTESSADVLVARALGDVRGALRDVFDRLFVKVRIPGFDLTAADLEDPALRRALVTLFERLLDASPCDVAGGAARGDAVARLERRRVREVLSSFADAPFGAPAMLRALAVLVPTRCEGEPLLSAPLARYAGALDAALARCEGTSGDVFDDALAHGGDRALDAARADLLAALLERCAVAAA